jgi:hypothetical protein
MQESLCAIDEVKGKDCGSDKEAYTRGGIIKETQARTRQTSNTGNPVRVQCWICKESGHMSKHCKKRNSRLRELEQRKHRKRLGSP